jgi:Domain of unknown function (DUF4845)
MAMRARQRGVTLMGLIFGSVLLVVLALLGMKLLPAYIEYFTIKKAVVGIAIETRGNSPAVSEVRRLFENRQAIDDFKAVKSSDLEISKVANDVQIVASYRKEIPLVANVGIYIDFVASSN